MSPAVDYERCGLAETKDRFSALTAKANLTGRPFTVLKGGKPWVEVRPLAVDSGPDDISITPTRRVVPVNDLDELFAGYSGEYVPEEDRLASPVGREAM